ncbi:MAG: hypothetical protein NC924_10065 [Candidatus Omnitrophica bacterium]|nr:hypothetical protein [Candidatus Omnitrophota bacterium]
MRKIVFKMVNVISVYKLFAAMSFIIGFVLALFGVGFFGEQVHAMLETIPFIGTALTGFFAAIAVGVILSLIGGLFFAIVAALYNVFSIIMGGIEMEIEDK